MTTPRYALLIPVKDSHTAKSRLGVGDQSQRARLMEAFARDSITAARASAYAEVHVVGDPAGLSGLAAGLGVPVLSDEGDGDLNLALRRAAARLSRAADVGVAVMLADLPCLRTADLDAALAAATSRAYVADADGSGTTLLVAPAGTELDPHFGAGSSAAHAASGAVGLDEAWTSLRLDVDTTRDLESALRFGVGEHTAKVTSSLL